jgi:carbamoyl-phosphate synthase large subunit
LYKIRNIVDIEKRLRKCTLDTLPVELLTEAKKRGFSDFQIKSIIGCEETDIREKRKQNGIFPWVKQIDTLAAEYPARTNYLYLTYNASGDDLGFEEKNKVIVLGGGPYRIGSSVEFDWCCVNAVMTLKKMNYNSIIINNNPETVSTDYDIGDKLYFDELTLERVLDIYEK